MTDTKEKAEEFANRIIKVIEDKDFDCSDVKTILKLEYELALKERTKEIRELLREMIQ